jgi:excisionase family DNA binding protein
MLEPAALKVSTVAQRLGVNPKTVYRMLETGQLRGVRAGRLWRVPVDALDEYLRTGGQHGDPDDELSPDDLAAVREGLEAIRRGEFITLEEWEGVIELLTIRETAELLKVSPITVRRYIADGRLPAVRVGRGVRVRKEAVDQLLTPVERTTARRGPRVPAGRPLTYDDPLWQLVGSAASAGPTDVSANKHKYLADAYAPAEE